MNPFNFLGSIYNGTLSSKLLEMIQNQSTKFEDVLDEDYVLVQDFKDNKQQVLE